MTEIPRPVTEGEHFQSKIRTVFRTPPEIPLAPVRSALLVGSRGAGKTTLLCYLKDAEPSSTIYLSAAEELGDLLQDNIEGATDGALPSMREDQKLRAEQLMARAVIRELLPTLGQDICSELCRSSAPALSGIPNSEVHQWIRGSSPKAGALDHSWAGSLRRILTGASNRLLASNLRLRVLFDRADMCPPHLLTPLLRLLDQPGPYIALVATRPAPNKNPDWGPAGPAQPGDHYNIYSIARSRHSSEWRDFVKSAIRAQYEETIMKAGMPSQILDRIVFMAADSVRMAVELTYYTLVDGARTWPDRLARACERARLELIGRVEGPLKPWVTDVSQLAAHWRDTVLRQTHVTAIRTPVVIDITTGVTQPALIGRYEPPSSVDRLVAAGLECGAFLPPEGEAWHPRRRFGSIELAPLLLWSREQPVEAPAGVVTTPHNLRLSKTDFLKKGGRYAKAAHLFVAYAFDINQSRDFLGRLKSALSAFPGLENVHLHTGHVPYGTEWADAIRMRLRRSTLGCVADVTGCRREIVVEMGFARGLGRRIIPVVASPSDVEALPKWMPRHSVGNYADAELDGLVQSIFDYVYSAKELATPALAQPTPHQAAVIGTPGWLKHTVAKIEAKARADRLHFDTVAQVGEGTYDASLKLAARASFLVVPVDGTQDTDVFSHFAAGLLVARPTIGEKPSQLDRVVVLARETPSTPVAASLRHLGRHVVVADPGDAVVNAFTSFVDQMRGYRRKEGD